MSANVGATRNRTDVFLKYRNQARSGSRPLGTGLPGSPSKASDKYVPDSCVAGKLRYTTQHHIIVTHKPALLLPAEAPASCLKQH